MPYAAVEGEPFDRQRAKALIRSIIETGALSITRHAQKEMDNDLLNRVDVVNVLRGGHMTEPAELVNGTWRYRIRTNKIVVVVAFRSETELVVVTAWRLKP